MNEISDTRNTKAVISAKPSSLLLVFLFMDPKVKGEFNICFLYLAQSMLIFLARKYA